MTEVWFRNPHNYIRELVEAGVARVAWDRGQLVKSKLDPIKHADLYFGTTFDWRILAIGIQGTAEYTQGDEWFKPTAVYPTWEYGDDMRLLEELMSSPIGEDTKACSDTSVPGDERPVLGQPHVVVITNFPNTVTGTGRAFVSQLKTLQEDYPDCTLHLHGLYSQRIMYGMGFKSVDVDPRSSASKGKINLPMGKESTIEKAIIESGTWITRLGFKPVDLKVPANRCIFNIKSALWAAENFGALYNFRVRADGTEVDHTSSDEEFQPSESSHRLTVQVKGQPGDKFMCNTCSQQDKCTHYRDGAVCSIPGAEPKELATFFGSRNADVIIDGLGTLAAANARRLQKGMIVEDQIGDIDKEVTKLMGQVFDQGTKLAKLIEPGRFGGGARVQVNVGAGAQASVIGAVNPKQLVAGVIRELEAQGYTRDQITPEMVTNLLSAGQNPEQTQRSFEAHRVIEG